MVYSFDVFDTCITRPCFWPGTVFEMLAHEEGLDRIAGPCGPGFTEHRIAAERGARRKAPGGEPTLEEIYKELEAVGQYGKVDFQRLMAREIELEKSLWVPVPATLAIVERHRRRGHRVCFTSNMYLPGNLIRERLRAFGFLIEDDELFLSSELRANKESGALFGKVLSYYGIKARQLHHCGDNLHADVKAPRAAGAKATHYKDLHAGKYELAAIAGEGLRMSWSSVIAGVCRLRRVSGGSLGAHARCANSVVGPVLVTYVAWVLMRALADGIRNLQFVSRDGYMLRKIADILIREWNLPLTTGYLLGSRRAWHHLAVSRPIQELTWLLEGGEPNIAAVCEMLRLDPSEVMARMSSSEWTADQLDAPLSMNRLVDFLSDLDSHAGDWVVETCGDSSEIGLVREYLAGQGIRADAASAVIDLGWQGRAHDSLDRIAGFPVKGYYLALDGDRPANREPFRACMFPEWFEMRNASSSMQDCMPDSFMHLFEAFSTENAGSVCGYMRRGGVIEALRGDYPKAELERWGIETLQEEVIRFTETAAPQIRWIFARGVPEEQLKETLCRIILEFSKNPTRDELELWADFPYQTGKKSPPWEPLAMHYPFSARTSWTWLRTGRHPCTRAVHRPVEWKTGSRMLTESTTFHGRVIKMLLRGRSFVKRAAGRVFASSVGGKGHCAVECRNASGDV